MLVPCIVAGTVLGVLGLLLLLHHGYKHMDDPPYSAAKSEGCPGYCCFFQLKDVSNHETWVVVACTNALKLLIVGLLVDSGCTDALIPPQHFITNQIHSP